VAASLRGSSSPPQRWCDARGRIGAAAAATGILPEDAFDEQPYVNDSLVFVCEARLDNRAELIDRLAIGAAAGARMADSEILWRAYQRWREGTPQWIYGDFAYVAWDRAANRLAAAVDHIGNVSLFYCIRGESIFLATQLAALMQHPAIPCILDEESLGLMVAPRTCRGRTAFRGIHHLSGGMSLSFANGELRCQRWWNPDSAVTHRYRDERDYVAAARALFADAVSVRLRAKGEIVATLSGGLDSGLVTSVAARQLANAGRTLTAYTSVPEPGLKVRTRPGWDADDGPWAAMHAETHPNLVHRLVAPGGIVPPDILPAVHSISRTPLRNTANHVWLWQIAEAARAGGARVVLTGEWGNPTISATGTPRFRDVLCNPRRSGALLLSPLRFVKGVGSRWIALHGSGSLRLRLSRPGAAFLPERFARSHVRELLPMRTAFTARPRFVEFAMRPSRATRLDAMAHFGVQYRDPTSDRQLIETLLTFPLHAFRAGGRSRGLAREMGRGCLPDAIRLRGTRGEQCADEAAWFTAYPERYRKLFEAIRASRSAAEILDMSQVAGALEDLFAGRGPAHLATTIHRALDVGLFAAEFDSGTLGAVRAAA